MKFRLETVLDKNTGMYYGEMYYPENATEPYVRSKAVFTSAEAAVQHTLDTFKKMFPDQPVAIREGL